MRFMSLELAILFWLHIFSAIGWMGAAMVFGMVIGPLLPSFNPATRGEVVLKLFPKYIRYSEAFSLMAVIFGAVLALAISGGDFSKLSPTTTWGLFITVGAIFALSALGMAFGVIAPAAHKLVHLTENAVKNPGPPSPDLMKTSARLKTSATIGLVLLILVLVCMVAAAEL